MVHFSPVIAPPLPHRKPTTLPKMKAVAFGAQYDVSIVTVVGVGMRGTPGIAGRLFSALGWHQVNIIAIAQGSSACSISLVVDSEDTGTAVAHVHELI